MGEEYDRIEKVESGISDLLKSILLKERSLFAEMIELVLESIKPLQGYDKKGVAREKAVLLTIASRMFNDCDAAKHLLERGLPDQARTVTRDIIECTLLFRLFLKKPKMAVKWLMDLKEYQPGDAYAKLQKLGVDAKEYALYGPMSHEAHSNLLASLSHVQEIAVQEWTARIFRCGSAWNPENVCCIQWDFVYLFLLLLITLKEPLAELYSKNSEMAVFKNWETRVAELPAKVDELISEVSAKTPSPTPGADLRLDELVGRKMRVEETKRILGLSE